MSGNRQASDERLGAAADHLRGRRWRIVPHPGPVAERAGPTGGRSGALRAAIFGLNDGLVSNLSLIFGVAGAGVSNSFVIVAGIAGLLAGAFSMGAGEYISMRVQREVFERLIHLEAHELGTQPDEERRELVDIYVAKGLSRPLAERIADEVHRDPELSLQTHAREELGLDPQGGLGSPWAAAGSSFATFSFGAVVPLLPFFFTEGGSAVLISSVVAGLTLFGVGAGVSYLTARPVWLSGLRMLLIGALAAAITYGVGTLLDTAVI
ncbi:MAG: VIT1/CCC1 transporter family protein [Actinomycetota bacterium]